VGRACGTHGRGEKSVQCCDGKSRRKQTTRKIEAWGEEGIRTHLRETGLEGVEWIQLAQDKDPWWAVVNTAMSLRAMGHGIS
jgi:hypothetical protein